jgi:hypothetical protein
MLTKANGEKKEMENNLINTDEFLSLIKKTAGKDSSEQDLRVLRKALHNNPHLWRTVGDLAEQVAHNLISKIEPSPALEESLITGWYEMQKEIGGESPNSLEILLVQQIVLSWLRLQIVEYKYTNTMSKSTTLKLGKYWESRLSAAQRRHFRSIETLARVRRLLAKTPAVQVNIATDGGQQVNLAGDMKNK